MDRSQATYEAYDGVALKLLNGVVVRCAALTVDEAVRYLRLLSSIKEAAESTEEDEDAAVYVIASEAHDTLMSEFPERIGILEERIADIGLEVEGPGGPIEFGDLTLRDALALIDVLALALGDTYSTESTEAKVRVLDEFPLTFGVEGLCPADVFTLSRSFAEHLYLLIYGLAQDFLDHLTLSPGVKVMELRAALTPTRA